MYVRYRSLEKYLAENTGKDKGKGKAKALTANLADITLDESHNHPGFFDYDDLDGLGGGGNVDFDLGLDADFALFDEDDELAKLAGPSRPNKRAREDGEEEEGEERQDGDLSVELGRDAAPHLSSDRGSLAPLDFNKNKDLDGDFGMLAPEDEDLGGFDAGLDLGFDQDFGGGFDDAEGEQLPREFSLIPQSLCHVTHADTVHSHSPFRIRPRRFLSSWIHRSRRR